MTTTARPELPTSELPPQVSAAQVQALPEGSVRLLDVRSAGEYESCRIPGAVNVPLQDLQRHLDALGAAAGPLVLVCQSGGRAEQARGVLAATGRPDLHVLQGGMNGWQQAAGPVQTGRQKWALERQVRLVAGSLVLLAVLASTLVPGLKWVAAGVGFGLTFAALSNTCMMGNLLSRLPYNRGSRRDIERAVQALLPVASA